MLRGSCSAAFETFRRRDILRFVSETGITDVATLAELEQVLRDLAEEKEGRQSPIDPDIRLPSRLD